MSDLWASLCLVAVLEGLLLFAFPAAWKRMAEQMQSMENHRFGLPIVYLRASPIRLYLPLDQMDRIALPVGCGGFRADALLGY